MSKIVLQYFHLFFRLTVEAIDRHGESDRGAMDIINSYIIDKNLVSAGSGDNLVGRDKLRAEREKARKRKVANLQGKEILGNK